MITNSFPLSAMKGVLLFVFLLRMLAESVGGAYADASLSSPQPLVNHGLNTHTDDASATRIMHDIMSHQLSTRSIFTRSSPECWMASITTINRWKHEDEHSGDGVDRYQKHVHLSGSSYCASMTTEEQEVLALELTNCQLMKEKRQFYDVNIASQDAEAIEILGDEQQLCSVGNGGMKSYAASSCLPLMSEYALNLYHQILLYTQDVCTRLTEEKMMLQKEEVTQMLVHASSAVSQQMQIILEGTASAVEKMQVQSAMLDDQSVMMREQREELQRMSIARRREERETTTMVQKQTALLKEQTSMMKAQQLESDRLHKEREQAAALAIDQMTNQTASLLQNHAEKMNDHQNDLEVAFQNREKEAAMAVEKMKMETTTLIAEQANKIKEMQEIITNASSQMQPLSSIESYVRMATGGFTVLKSLLNFFLSMNVAWVITTMPLVSRSRRYLFGIFTLGFLAEIAAVSFADNALIVDSDEMDNIEIVRDWTRVSAIATLLLSCFLRPKKDPSQITMDELKLLRSQMDFVSKLNENASSVPTETRVERIEVPNIAEHHQSTAVKFSEKRGRSRARMRPKERFITSNRNLQPRMRRSRSPYRPSLTELALPVVTPIKPRAKSNVSSTAASPRSHQDYQATYYVHRSDALAKQEEEANRLQLEYWRALHERAASGTNSGEETCGSSSDGSSVESSTSNGGKKRKVSEMYASSSEENFFSANDDMSVSSTTSAVSPSRIQEKKKCKLTNVQIH